MKTITLLLAAFGALFLSGCASSKSGSCCASSMAGSCCATKSGGGCESCAMGSKKSDSSMKKGTAAKHDMKAM